MKIFYTAVLLNFNVYTGCNIKITRHDEISQPFFPSYLGGNMSSVLTRVH